MLEPVIFEPVILPVKFPSVAFILPAASTINFPPIFIDPFFIAILPAASTEKFPPILMVPFLIVTFPLPSTRKLLLPILIEPPLNAEPCKVPVNVPSFILNSPVSILR